jgi:hypothetical protein
MLVLEVRNGGRLVRIKFILSWYKWHDLTVA